MLFTQLLEAPLNRIFFSSINLIILLLMLVMSARLFVSRRKKAYFSFGVSLFIVIVRHILIIIGAGLDATAETGWIGYFDLLLKAVAFIALNLGIYQLYNSTRFKQVLTVTVSIVIAALLSAAHIVFRDFPGTVNQVRMMQDIGLELYIFLVIFLSHQWISPRIGQWGKYQASLALYFLYQLMHVANLYMLDGKYPALGTAAEFIPVLYYFLLFIILFERVVELLQASYNRSITDSLTGLYNRQFWTNRLQKYIHYGVPVSVIFADIDNFKALNDTQGHEKGDEALKKVSSVLKERCEDVGIPARFGGEEMVVLVTEPDIDPAELSESIRAGVETEAGVTVSVGFSKFRKGVTADTLVKQADEAMYQAKSSGKNKVCRYNRQKQLHL